MGGIRLQTKELLSSSLGFVKSQRVTFDQLVCGLTHGLKTGWRRIKIQLLDGRQDDFYILQPIRNRSQI